MDVKEKLVELLKIDPCPSPFMCSPECRYSDCDNCFTERFADHLIANGVTVQEWIPVTEMLPEDVYGKDRERIVVFVRTKSGNVSQCARMADYDLITGSSFDDFKFVKNGKFYWSKGKVVTHWMPLPEPPKGE